MKTACKRGATLAEMCVVLALVTIIGTMVTSFSVSVSRRTQLSAVRLEMTGDLDAVESIADSWLGQMKLQNAELSVQGNDICAGLYTLSFRNGVLRGTLPDGKSVTYRSAYVKKMTFSQVEGTTSKLFFCTVTYDMSGLSDDEAEQVQVFCINPRVGDIYDAD